MASCMYRVGDYVYFEANPSDPYQIRRIEELNKTANSNVEARVACFYRRRDISAYLVNQADRRQITTPWDDDDDVLNEGGSTVTVPSTTTASSQQELNDVQKHQLRHRELFLTRQIETLLATNIRGKCLVTLHNETESFLSYVNTDDLFFYQLVYDPQQKTLLADRGEIRVGGKYQADVPSQMSVDDKPDAVREDLIWNCSTGLTEKQIEQFLIVARSIGTFARALDCPTALKHPSLHMSAASASRDATLFFAMDTLHKHNYDLASATCCLVPSTGPILVKDQMEDWSAAEANAFEDAIEKCGKHFNAIQREFLPWKSLKGIIEYYYMWKTTDRYVQQRRLKSAEQENKLKQVFIPNYNKAHQSLLPQRPQNDGKPCESCGSLSSPTNQWYQYGAAHMHTRLCSDCWIYYKKLGGLKYPRKNDGDRPGPDRRCQERPTSINKFQSYRCTVDGCGKECKTKSQLQRHSTLTHGIMCRASSPRPVSRNRNTFCLFTTPITRAARTIMNIRRLARHISLSADVGAIRKEWEKESHDIHQVYNRLRENYKEQKQRLLKVRLDDVLNKDNLEIAKTTFDDITQPYTNEPVYKPEQLRFPVPSEDFFAKFSNINTSIMKKRPYESTDSSNEGPSPKRTLISRQNLIKSKSPNNVKLSRSRAYTVSFIDAPDGIYLRVTKEIKHLRKDIPQNEIRRIARAPWKKLNTNFVSYADDDIVVLD